MVFTNEFILKFVSENWLGILLVYGVFKSIFPESKLLARFADYVSNLFPILKKGKIEG
jgi:hypothetical protein